MLLFHLQILKSVELSGLKPIFLSYLAKYEKKEEYFKSQVCVCFSAGEDLCWCRGRGPPVAPLGPDRPGLGSAGPVHTPAGPAAPSSPAAPPGSGPPAARSPTSSRTAARGAPGTGTAPSAPAGTAPPAGTAHASYCALSPRRHGHTSTADPQAHRC